MPASEFTLELRKAEPAFGVPAPALAIVAQPAGLRRTGATTEFDGQKLYRWSVAAVVAGNAMDVASSWRRPEANPLLSKPGSQFGSRSVAIKAGFAGASLLIERWAVRSNPRLYRKFAWLNIAIAGGLGVTATYNFTLH